MLEVSQLSYAYGPTAVLNDVSLEVASGEVVALLGPNGAGKSTLVSLLTGSRKPSGGTILLKGRNPAARRGIRHRIGWVPQAVTLFDRLTVRENLRELGRIMGVKGETLHLGVERALQLTGLEAKRDQLAVTLSGGQQRLLNVGMALVHSPDLIILDEPTAGVDRSASRQLKRMIRRLRDEGLAIMLTTHELEDASELADRLVILIEGSIRAAGETDNVISRVFSNNREVSVMLAPGSADEAALTRCRACLAEAGLLHGDVPEQWLGLMDNGRKQVDGLLQDLLGFGTLIREVRVRNPSLELLIRKLSTAGVAS